MRSGLTTQKLSRSEQSYDHDQCTPSAVLTWTFDVALFQVVFKRLYPKDYTASVSTRVSNALLVGKYTLSRIICALLFLI